MSQKDPNHSSTQRTILWTIIPSAVILTLLLTRQNHHTTAPRPQLSADLSGVKKEMKMETPTPAMHQISADTTSHNSTHMENAYPVPVSPGPKHSIEPETHH